MSLFNTATDWFSEAKYGLFVHFLPGNASQFPRKVDEFDVMAFAEDCYQSGASYVIFTLGQNSGYINAPNAAYEKYSGYHPGVKSPNRELIRELQKALDAKGIKLMLYSSALAPNEDEQARLGLGCTDKSNAETIDWIITEAFKERWSEVLQEFSYRYGTTVHGWWIDGCYEWAGFNEAVAEAYNAALKQGNPDSIIRFNSGVDRLKKTSVYEDYTAGEYTDLLAPVCTNRWLDGIQWHELSHITKNWGAGELRYTDSQLAEHINKISANGGVITFDIPLEEPYVGDRILADALQQLMNIKETIYPGK